MNPSDIRQQMAARERFAPDTEAVRTAVRTGRTQSSATGRRTRPTRTLALLAAAVVVVIVAAAGVVRVLLPAAAPTASPSTVPSANSVVGLLDVTWRLTSTSDGDRTAAVTTNPDTLQFTANGAVAGVGRCYSAAGHWSSEGSELRLQPLTVRGHSCPPNLDPGQQQQEQAAGNALTSLSQLGATADLPALQVLTLHSGSHALTYRNGGLALPEIPSPDSIAQPPLTQPVRPTTSSPSLGPSMSMTTPVATVPRPQRINNVTIYDPIGDGHMDNANLAASSIDGDQQTAWKTFSCAQQFPLAKPGVGLMLTFEHPIMPTSVTISSDTPGTVIEVRSATTADPPYAQTALLDRAAIPTGSHTTLGTVTVKLPQAEPSRYLVIFVVQMGSSTSPTQEGLVYRSDINEISVLGP